MLEDTSIAFGQEFLLLASKCQTFSQQDIKIFHSLVQVVHPSLSPEKKARERLELDGRFIWTTEEGLRKTQEKIQHIGTVEVVENAREVEAARALGDLRENSEYKFACERRRHLQSELRRLSHDLNRARVITEQDIDLNEVGIGNIVEVANPSGEKQTYTILGPWDAVPEKNILSFQSMLAQAMVGRKVHDKFSFKEEEYQITKIGSYLQG
jgi:transcription elongation GreA/GreB family factor